MGSQRVDPVAGALWIRAAARLHAPGTVAETFQAIVALARSIVTGSEFAGITVLDRDGSLASPAFTDPLVQELDQAQAALGEGPCLEVMTGPAQLLRIESMEREHRWPRFAARARELGVSSMLACRLSCRSGAPAALNLHAAGDRAFDDSAVQVAAVYAAHATLALTRVALLESLRGSMDSRQAIGEATGILMERHQLTSEAAFARLVVASQRLNVKLRTIAEQLVRTGQDPDGLRPEDFDPAHPRH